MSNRSWFHTKPHWIAAPATSTSTPLLRRYQNSTVACPPSPDIILTGPGLPTLANLTVLVVGKNAIRSVDGIPSLLAACPQLTTLDLTIKLPPMYSGAAPPSPERLAKETNLRRLRLIIEEARERLSFGQTLVEPSYNPLVDPLETVISLLRQSGFSPISAWGMLKTLGFTGATGPTLSSAL